MSVPLRVARTVALTAGQLLLALDPQGGQGLSRRNAQLALAADEVAARSRRLLEREDVVVLPEVPRIPTQHARERVAH